MNYFLILFLFVILAIKCKSSGFDNNKFVSSICNDSIIKRTDTVIGYVIKYDFDDINKFKHGSLES
jgi:hypothetical protein